MITVNHVKPRIEEISSIKTEETLEIPTTKTEKTIGITITETTVVVTETQEIVITETPEIIDVKEVKVQIIVDINNKTEIIDLSQDVRRV